MDLLKKFDDVVITNDNAISQEDRSFCEAKFNFYTKVYKTYESHQKTMLELQKEQKCLCNSIKEQGNRFRNYIWEYSDLSANHTTDAMIELTCNFIEDICDFFTEKYSITVTTSALKYNENSREARYITLDEVLEKCILGNLDGLSFYEKAVEEIKLKAKTERRIYRDGWNYELKGKLIKFRFSMGSIYPALFFYDSGETQLTSRFSWNKIEDRREFENGNTDIKFTKSEYALDFARRYLGYVTT